jgi:hypothetical protein
MKHLKILNHERNTSVEFQVSRQPRHSPLSMEVDGHEICDTQGSLYIFLLYGHFLFLEIVLWIRIRIHFVVLDPDPYWEYGSGFRIMEIDQNLQINLVSSLFQKGFCTVPS